MTMVQGRGMFAIVISRTLIDGAKTIAHNKLWSSGCIKNLASEVHASSLFVFYRVCVSLPPLPPWKVFL